MKRVASYSDSQQLRRRDGRAVFETGRNAELGLAHHGRLEDVAAAAVLAELAVVQVHHETGRLKVESHCEKPTHFSGGI